MSLTILLVLLYRVLKPGGLCVLLTSAQLKNTLVQLVTLPPGGEDGNTGSTCVRESHTRDTETRDLVVGDASEEGDLSSGTSMSNNKLDINSETQAQSDRVCTHSDTGPQCDSRNVTNQSQTPCSRDNSSGDSEALLTQKDQSDSSCSQESVKHVTGCGGDDKTLDTQPVPYNDTDKTVHWAAEGTHYMKLGETNAFICVFRK